MLEGHNSIQISCELCESITNLNNRMKDRTKKKTELASVKFMGIDTSMAFRLLWRGVLNKAGLMQWCAIFI